MKKVLLVLTALAALIQAEDTVHYDKGIKEDKSISKPNHPSTDLYK